MNKIFNLKVSRIPEKVEAKALRLLNESAIDSDLPQTYGLPNTENCENLINVSLPFSHLATGKVVSRHKVSTSS